MKEGKYLTVVINMDLFKDVQVSALVESFKSILLLLGLPNISYGNSGDAQLSRC